jgi:hypothetical protein
VPAGRPRKQIDARKVEQLAMVGCSHEEISLITGIHRNTLERNYSATIKAGTAKRNHSLRKMQYEAAKRGNVVMMIWLGKQWLNQRDRGPFDEIEDPLGELLRDFRAHYNTAANKPNGKGEVTNGKSER